jgi:hypothetical protein
MSERVFERANQRDGAEGSLVHQALTSVHQALTSDVVLHGRMAHQ